ncbi:MAG: hypothetical protein GF421_03115 [Candidatus Aminicenantes bacterium]|nr:hypothetical protein [Candidatus Aminicenantes bacterium]
MNKRPHKKYSILGPAAALACVTVSLFFLFSGTGTSKAPICEHPKALRPGKDKFPGTIVWSSSRHGTWDIFKMKADGTEKVRLTHDPEKNFHPVWSDKGEWIYFQRNEHIYRMQPDGSGLQPVIQNGFSFDLVERSSKIIYVVSEKSGSSVQLYDIQKKTSEELIPARVPEFQNKQIRFPTLSPDGDWLSFSSAYPKAWSIHLVKLSRNIHFPYGRGCMPQYSPDSQHVAWVHSGNHDIYVGTPHRGQKRGLNIVIPERPHNYFPKWSPDGKYLVFAAGPTPKRGTSDYEIYIKPLKGGKAVRLTFHPATDNWPDIYF